MLVAINEKNERKIALYTDKGDKFRCPCCNGNVILKKGEIKVHHFAHTINNDNCLFKGESLEHLNAKVEIYTELLKSGLYEECTVEYKIDDIICDVYFTDGINEYAIEIQKTPLSEEELKYRMEKYSKTNIYVLWAIPASSRKEIFLYKKIKIKNFEKNLQQYYYGRVYFWFSKLFFKPMHFGKFYGDEFYSFGPICNLNEHFKRAYRKKSSEYYNTEIPSGKILIDTSKKWWGDIGENYNAECLNCKYRQKANLESYYNEYSNEFKTNTTRVCVHPLHLQRNYIPEISSIKICPKLQLYFEKLIAQNKDNVL